MIRLAPRHLSYAAACLSLGGLLGAEPAAAQSLAAFTAFTALPSFAWPKAEGEESRWAGSYARLSTGFEVMSSKRFGGYAGPTVGFEGGRMWQEGQLVYGIGGKFDYLAAIGGGPTPGFGGLAYSRDFSGALQVKVGALVTPDVLLYARAGASAVNERLSFGATPFSLPFDRQDIALRPNAAVGVEWAVTDKVTIAVEAGVVGRGLR